MPEPLLKIINKKCTVCYSCVRTCPVKAIEVRMNQDYPKIVADRCIGCGSCLHVCATDAILVRDSKENVKLLLNSGSKVAAVCAPSISGEFVDITDYRKFVEMIRILGFSYVHEVSFGTDIVAYKYKELLENFNGKFYLTANCPAVFSLVEKYHPEIIENLAPISTPMIANAKILHHKYGNDVKIVYVGPCIASKDEALRYEGDAKIDAVLTYKELRELFTEFNIKESAVQFSDFDKPYGNKGSLYPISKGIIQAAGLNSDLLTGHIITTEGKNNTLTAVSEFEKNTDSICHHFNLFYCGGCLMGPGMSRQGNKFERTARVIDYARKRAADFDEDAWEEQIDIYKELDLTPVFKVDDQRLPVPSEERVQEVLKVIGKEINEGHSGCDACGYKTCRDFAESVAKGLSKPDLCLTYSLKSKQDYIKTLKITNQKLADTKEALRISEEHARKEQQVAKDALDRTSMMLQKLPTGVVIIDDKLKIIEANSSFINILGNEASEINEIIPGLCGADIKALVTYSLYNLFTYVLDSDENILNRDVHFDDRLFNVSVFTLKKNKIVGAVIRDMYQPEVQKEEIINRVTDVIDMNLQLVQKIGFILGEGAAEAEKMLSSIIESYQSPTKNQ